LTPGVTMTLGNNIDYTIKYNSGYSDSYNIFTAQEYSTLKLSAGANMTFENTNVLMLDCHSNLVLNAGSQIVLQNGSKFCNRGAHILGNGKILVQGIVRNPGCPRFENCDDNIVKDSARIVIEEDATLEIPDSTTYVFEGFETALICGDNSTIKFGKGSKLVFEDGARINANYCRFVSYDSFDVWDGIYLSDLSRDTLKYCTFQNAVNGINIEDKVTSGINDPEPATLIENCTFKNSTSSALLNCVYTNNSQNVLVKDCDMVKTSSGGFASGYIVEYCPVNGVIIVDNTISYTETGITVIQSSPYIARNTLNGITNTGIGISLDNSNGTIEYNMVYNYDVSA
jgi:Periplasmic copper-binding protein (NosD)